MLRHEVYSDFWSQFAKTICGSTAAIALHGYPSETRRFTDQYFDIRLNDILYRYNIYWAKHDFAVARIRIGDIWREKQINHGFGPLQDLNRANWSTVQTSMITGMLALAAK